MSQSAQRAAITRGRLKPYPVDLDADFVYLRYSISAYIDARCGMAGPGGAGSGDGMPRLRTSAGAARGARPTPTRDTVEILVEHIEQQDIRTVTNL